eukprot:scaffold210942_cov30-Tisochrysis_lutea.AAC.1
MSSRESACGAKRHTYLRHGRRSLSGGSYYTRGTIGSQISEAYTLKGLCGILPLRFDGGDGPVERPSGSEYSA